MISEAFSDPLNLCGASDLTAPSFDSARCPQGLQSGHRSPVTWHQPQPKPVSTVYTAGSNPHLRQSGLPSEETSPRLPAVGSLLWIVDVPDPHFSLCLCVAVSLSVG